jgi:WD40 repeat protein
MGVSSVAFSPDGKILASGSGTHLGSPTARSEVSFTDDAIQLWDVASRQPFVVPFIGHTNAVSSIAFSPDGTILASGSDDATIRLWDVVGGQPLDSLPSGYSVVIAGEEAASHAMKSVAFSPDGMFLASGSNDTSIHLWDLDPTSLVRRACAIATRNLTRQEWRQYLGNLAYHKTCANVP